MTFAQFVAKLDARICEWAKRPEEIERAITAGSARWSRGDRWCRVRPAGKGVVDYGIGLALKGETTFAPPLEAELTDEAVDRIAPHFGAYLSRMSD